jgi:hypothetical protein
LKKVAKNGIELTMMATLFSTFLVHIISEVTDCLFLSLHADEERTLSKGGVGGG